MMNLSPVLKLKKTWPSNENNAASARARGTPQEENGHRYDNSGIPRSPLTRQKWSSRSVPSSSSASSSVRTRIQSFNKGMPQSPVADHVQGEKQDILAWINGHLRAQKAEMASSVESALANGITLIKIAKDIFHEEPPRFIANPLHLFQRVENLQICMKWIKAKGVHVASIHIEDLTSGNLKSCLALCRALMNYETSHRSAGTTGAKGKLPIPPPGPHSGSSSHSGTSTHSGSSSHSGTSTHPIPAPHSGQGHHSSPGSNSGFPPTGNLDKDDIAVLGWLGSVLNYDILNYQMLSDGLLLCQLVKKMAPGCLSDETLKRSSSERLESALTAAETQLSISRGLLDIGKLSQGREENYKVFSYLQRCQITYKQKKRQDYLRMDKEKAAVGSTQAIRMSGGGVASDHRNSAPFGVPEVRDSRRSQRQADPGPHIKPSTHSTSAPTSGPHPSGGGQGTEAGGQRGSRSNSPGQRGEPANHWSGRMQQQQQQQQQQLQQLYQSRERVAFPGSEMEEERKSSSGGSGMPRPQAPMIYPPPYDPPPPPPPSTSGGEQHPHYVPTLLPRGPSFRQKGASQPTVPVTTNNNPLKSSFRMTKSAVNEDGSFPQGFSSSDKERVAKETTPPGGDSSVERMSSEGGGAGESESALSSVESMTTVVNSNYSTPPTHPTTNGLSPSVPAREEPTGPVHRRSLSDEHDSGGPVSMSVLRQHLQSSSHPQHVQSHFLSRLELLEHELSDLNERLDIERVQYTQRIKAIETVERCKREELEKETRKLADLARQLMKHYDNCFVGLARQIAFLQTKVGMESDDTVDVLVGGDSEVKKSSEAKQLIDEITSLKHQIQNITSKPLVGSGSGDITRKSSGSSPPSSLPNTPEPPLTSDGQVRGSNWGNSTPDTGKKILFVRKAANKPSRAGAKNSKEKMPIASMSAPPITPSTSLAELAQTANITKTSHKKLKKFFGEDLPHVENLNTFLCGLGYPELIPVFAKEKVTLNELQLMTEQHLCQMSVPMGPRVAILAEIRSLEGVSLED